ncbi:MAG: DoxX family protein [Proteobacteria bacterium]|nr:DoxX family protein [Pseudomonadota bacterium]
MTDITTEPTRLLVPALGAIYEKLEPLGWPLVRVATGLLLVPHGYMKLFGGMEGTIGFFSQIGLEPAALLAWYVALLEFVGGILLAAGFLTRVVAAQVVGFMAVAVTIHWGNGFAWTSGGYEYPLMWGSVALAILFKGAGPLSVDAKLGREI